MSDSDQQVLVLVTAPDHPTGDQIAQVLLDQRLAACVSLLPGLVSHYRWEGRIQQDQEVLLLIKTRAELLAEQLIPRIRELHPYQVPEIISLPITGGYPAYLAWILQETGETPKQP